MIQTCIGIDLAWQTEKNPSGIAVISEDNNSAELVAVDSLLGTQAVKEIIVKYAATNRVIAIDAPLIVTNATGRRECENVLSRCYGANHASCHSTSLKTFGGERPASATLADWLATDHGFVHAPDATADSKTMMEVYPHAAFVALRQRDRIIKYKKGSVEQKCKGLREVQCELRAILSGDIAIASNALSEELLARDPATLKGSARKSFEDELDAVLCAYLAYRFTKLGRDSFDVFGDGFGGYIVNPIRGPVSRQRTLR